MNEANEPKNVVPLPSSSSTTPQQPDALPEGLWNIRQTAQFLACSMRKVEQMKKVPPDQPGSIPFVKLPPPPGSTRSAIRFIPDEIRAWVALRFPSVAEFEAMRTRDRRRAG